MVETDGFLGNIGIVNEEKLWEGDVRVEYGKGEHPSAHIVYVSLTDGVFQVAIAL